MKWNTYQDQENRAYSHILTSLFPEQTRTLPRILCWSVVFLVDLIVCVAFASYWGLMKGRNSFLILAAVILLFWLQGKLWYFAAKSLNKKKGDPHAL